MNPIQPLLKNGKQAVRFLQFHVLWPAVYKLACRLRPVDPKFAVFADSYARQLTDNMVPVWNELEKQGVRTKAVLAPAKTGNRVLDLTRAEGQTLRFLWNYAHAGTVCLAETYLPVDAAAPRKGTFVLQLWHGGGAFKQWGYAILDKTFGADPKSVKRFPMHRNYSAIICSAPKVVPDYQKAFRGPVDRIHPTGLPRTDVFFNRDFVGGGKERLCRFYDEKQRGNGTFDKPLKDLIGDRKIILYAPTFRGVNIAKARSDCALDFERLREKLGSRYVLLYKLHPYVKNGYDVPESCRNFAFDVSGSPADDALCAADLLVSDYSCIIYDYALLGRPMVFYPYDLEDYTKERAFCYPYRTLVPGPIAETETALEEALDHAEERFDPEVVTRFRETYMTACDGHATARVMELIRQHPQR